MSRYSQKRDRQRQAEPQQLAETPAPEPQQLAEPIVIGPWLDCFEPAPLTSPTTEIKRQFRALAEAIHANAYDRATARLALASLSDAQAHAVEALDPR